jgi:hypothetical protein
MKAKSFTKARPALPDQPSLVHLIPALQQETGVSLGKRGQQNLGLKLL